MSRLILLLAVFLVSTAGLFAHQALTEATPLAIAAWRLGLAALFFGALSLLRPGEVSAAPVTKPVRWRLVLAGLCLAAHFVTWFAALDRTSVARATLLACTTPLWTTLGSLLLGRRRPTGRDLAALAVAGVGLWLVTQASAQAATRTTALGDVFGLSAGLLFGSYLLCVEGLHETISSQRQVTWAYSVAAGVLWAALLGRGGATLTYSPKRLESPARHDAGAADFRPHAAELVPAALFFFPCRLLYSAGTRHCNASCLVLARANAHCRAAFRRPARLRSFSAGHQPKNGGRAG